MGWYDTHLDKIFVALEEAFAFQDLENLGLDRNGRTRLKAAHRDIVGCSRHSFASVLEGFTRADISRL
jgi:hypothetical protein